MKKHAVPVLFFHKAFLFLPNVRRGHRWDQRRRQILSEETQLRQKQPMTSPMAGLSSGRSCTPE
ncbi:hypothetical protein [Alkalicoccus saliphilus]|uniref:Uncharacterized protein n=1 Tax=Alkalicoccus saliphilus TaxID=200989 RepID=A0A2T4U8S4_9BACI|nr:hypothetical protein [Alkalicoccus saliphilus]PTL39806.1 hypothetical protein C6Y45_03950 [Alkalicoccus saliphilus]